VSHKWRALHQVARRITADGKFREKDQSRPCLLRLSRILDNLVAIALEVPHRRIDLSQRYLHSPSVEGRRGVAKSAYKPANVQ